MLVQDDVPCDGRGWLVRQEVSCARDEWWVLDDVTWGVGYALATTATGAAREKRASATDLKKIGKTRRLNISLGALGHGKIE